MADAGRVDGAGDGTVSRVRLPGARLPGALALRAGLALGGVPGARSRLATQPALTAVLVVASAVVAVGVAVEPRWVPPAAMLLVLLGGVAVLRRVPMLVLGGVIAVETLVLVLGHSAAFTPGELVVQAIGLVVGLAFVRSREALGLQGAPSQLMLVDLRDRIAAHGRIPALPDGWRVESVVRSAHGEGFSGDFVVAARGGDGPRLEIVLVDVSGKGQEAGVRSLLLSGAFAGLLGAMPPPAFFPAANGYLVDQHWTEGFATAVHLAVDLDTGAFWLSRAGHPPAVLMRAAEGRITLIEDDAGPALGVLNTPVFAAHEGVLARGDSLLLYTDGLVEDRRRDVDQGIDRLMGAAERLVATGRGGAVEMLADLRAGEGDDRALVLVRRG